MNQFRLVLDPVACDGHGLCAELFPEGIELDDWGFPIIAGPIVAGPTSAGGIPDSLLVHARRAVSACPALALRMARAEAPIA
ncbi:MAG TPA: ferredoxin [Acidimicrobiales bacterium]|jgi:ferredoxin